MMQRLLGATLAILLAVFALAIAPSARADGPGPDDPRYAVKGKAQKTVIAPQDPATRGQSGTITLADGVIRLTIPTGYFYYPAPEARAHLQRIGAPAPSGEILGMIALAEGPRPVDDNFWGAVVTYERIGYVAEERADRLAAPDFVTEVQTARPRGRQPQAFAAAPSSDPTRHIVVWTEQYPAATTSARSFRQEQRLLGRKGVAGTTIVARADQMPTVNAAAPQMLNMIGFAPGQTYSSYSRTGDPAPVFDLPGVITAKPKPATTAAARTAPPPIAAPATAAPATAAPSPLTPATTEADPMEPLIKWLPWVGGGLLLIAIIPLLIGRMRGGDRGRDRDDPPPPAADGDPNITPAD